MQQTRSGSIGRTCCRLDELFEPSDRLVHAVGIELPAQDPHAQRLERDEAALERVIEALTELGEILDLRSSTLSSQRPL